MTCNYMDRARGRCTYRRTRHVKDHDLLLTLCQGLPYHCPWHVMKDPGASP